MPLLTMVHMLLMSVILSSSKIYSRKRVTMIMRVCFWPQNTIKMSTIWYFQMQNHKITIVFVISRTIFIKVRKFRMIRSLIRVLCNKIILASILIRLPPKETSNKSGWHAWTSNINSSSKEKRKKTTKSALATTLRNHFRLLAIVT